MRPRHWLAVLAALAAITLPGLGSARAATLGGIGASELTAWELASTTGAPTVLAWEDFDGPTGTSISGTAPDWGPGLWRSLGGVWRIDADRAGVDRVPLGSINVHVDDVFDAAVEVTLHRNGSSSWDAGVLLNDNDYSVLVVRWQSAQRGSLELSSWNGGFTRLARVRRLYRTVPAPEQVTLRVEAVGDRVAAYLDGTLVLSHTLSGQDVNLFKNPAHDGWGLWAEQDDTTTFDDFHVDSP